MRVVISRESADPYAFEWNIIHILCDSIRGDIVKMSINKYTMAVGQDFMRSRTSPHCTPHTLSLQLSAINLQTWLLNVKL